LHSGTRLDFQRIIQPSEKFTIYLISPIRDKVGNCLYLHVSELHGAATGFMAVGRCFYWSWRPASMALRRGRRRPESLHKRPSFHRIRCQISHSRGRSSHLCTASSCSLTSRPRGPSAAGLSVCYGPLLAPIRRHHLPWRLNRASGGRRLARVGRAVADLPVQRLKRRSTQAWLPTERASPR